MDAAGSGRNSHESENVFEEAQQEQVERPRELPRDLPKSLDDRQNFSSYNQETEYYDGWQGRFSESGPTRLYLKLELMNRCRTIVIHHSTQPGETPQF